MFDFVLFGMSVSMRYQTHFRIQENSLIHESGEMKCQNSPWNYSNVFPDLFWCYETYVWFFLLLCFLLRAKAFAILSCPKLDVKTADVSYRTNWKTLLQILKGIWPMEKPVQSLERKTNRVTAHNKRSLPLYGCSSI